MTHPHLYPGLWSQRNDRLWLNRLSRQQLEVNTLGQGCQHKMAFHYGKMVADANTWTTPKGNIGIARQPLFSLWRKTLGIKTFRVGKVIGFTMHGVGTDQYQYACRQV